MTAAVQWVLDGAIIEDAGDVGGDIQVGRAVSARFRSEACPEARFEVTIYATAKPYMDLQESDPECTHIEPEGWVCKNGWQEDHDPNSGSGTRCICWLPPEHLACSFKPGTVDLQAEYTYRRNGRIEDGIYESDDSDDITYEWVGSDIGYAGNGRTLIEEIEYATADAQAKVMDWVNFVNKYLDWDGRSAVNN